MGIGMLDEVEFQPRLVETEGPAAEGITPSILSAIGRTPLIPLQRLAAGLSARILAKVESLNPGGSIKDRVGVAMVEEAERRGWLLPGGTIIEATAGNTGVGLALAAAVKGYRCIFVLPDKMSGEKIRLLKAYGAEIVITPTSVPPDSPESYNGVADRLAREIPGGWRPNQFANLANPEVHYRETGSRDLGADRRQGHGLRRGRGDRRHDLRGGALPQGAQPRDPDHRGRPGGLDPLGRCTPALEGRGDRRGFRPEDAQRAGRRRMDPRRRRGELPHGPRPGPSRRSARRRLGRHRRGRGPAVCPTALGQRRGRRPVPRHRPQLSEQVPRR